MSFACHEQCVIINPFVFLYKVFDFFFVPFPTVFLGSLQHFKTGFIDLAIINMPWIFPEIDPFEIAFLKKLILDQHIRIDKIGIAGKGRAALIRRISESRGTKRQHLPIFLTGFFQKIGKVIGSFSQRTDPVRRGKGRDGH